ncbi:hypothetical protein DPMN_136899 [Dreissena polymorpha]|uniref:Uncharacterized protein n=1 Tax=Dreissena polymorpha TaxID=45954 RepID=A0A9D4G1R7_DREPO|nr:hypothetical protein DPMN_136899 [Dreissena polymorpha]
MAPAILRSLPGEDTGHFMTGPFTGYRPVDRSGRHRSSVTGHRSTGHRSSVNIDRSCCRSCYDRCRHRSTGHRSTLTGPVTGHVMYR